ncbi:hypothetical protein [Pseudomonas sp. MS19]|jgi:hypothetical protein|uniref:PA0061/PA0062 family lipoprotein n=1 Tax=Pseudomonas sp. MS19 TaxID=2579939 RepID=UPI001562C4E2|nr:hypothetical protein [Pseudomonas sp. MS19]NRH28199.1 hypothetical protein [Pseudomonas sp. MS19]
MRGPLLVAGVMLLSGCAHMWAYDSEQAWVDLSTNRDNRLFAYKVDDKPVDDWEYFQVTPGRHELVARVLFKVDGSNVGSSSSALSRRCEVKLVYADFAKGQRYRLEAGNTGFRAWAKLYDEHNQELARAKEGRCG